MAVGKVVINFDRNFMIVITSQVRENLDLFHEGFSSAL
jgi:hypothetical protein